MGVIGKWAGDGRWYRYMYIPPMYVCMYVFVDALFIPHHLASTSQSNQKWRGEGAKPTKNFLSQFSMPILYLFLPLQKSSEKSKAPTPRAPSYPPPPGFQRPCIALSYTLVIDK